MAFRTSNIDPMYVRNGLDHNSLDVGTLCLSPKINPWSANKPMNFGSASYAARVAAIPSVSGFKIVSRQLVHDPPTATYGYWLSDFEGYDHYARRPSNVIQNEFVLEAQDGNGLGTGYGRPTNSFAIRVDIPNTAVVLKWADEVAIQADTVSLTDTNDIVLPGSYSDGYARASLASMSETNHYLTVPLTLDLTSNRAGSTINRTYKIWYGDSNDYKKFQIPEGSTVTLSIKILNVGVNITASYDPMDNFPPLTIDSNPLYNGVYDSFNKRFTLTYLNIEGITKSVSTYPINYYRSFENKIGWSLKYQIVGNSGTKVSLTDVPGTMYYNADGTGTPGRYYVRWSGSIVFDAASGVPNGIETGDTIQFRMIPTTYYAPS